MTNRMLVILVVIGALLDVAVFTFQVTQYPQIQSNTAQTDCWTAVLDNIVTHRPPHIRPADIAAAQRCSHL